jgi:hypothetical protein
MTGKKSSDSISAPCIYFHQKGSGNTKITLHAAKRRADELDILDIVIASTSGKTGLEAARLFSGRNIIVVTHSTGFNRPGHQELIPEMRDRIEEAGARILTCQHALGGVGRAVRKKLGTYQLEEIIAYTLRIFGEGTKVAIESALMAADAGLISTSRECLSIGGTAEGADTAILLNPAHAQNFFDMRIVEYVAKPRAL